MTILTDVLFTMNRILEKERMVSLKKRRIVMFCFIGIFCLALFIWAGVLAGCKMILTYKNQQEAVVKKDKSEEKEQELSVPDTWNLLLVSREHPLPENYQIPVFTDLKNGHAVDSRIYPELQAMMDAARAEGLEPLICSSYRAWDRQQELYIRKVRTYVSEGQSWESALALAENWVQKPGHSEHQTGLALDIVDMTYQQLDEAQAETQVQVWLMAHCHEYGFILRYPKGKESLTGVSYEPWHYRYVGKEAAKEIMEKGICLEEYLLS